MANHLRGEIDTLIEKQKKANDMAKQSVELHEFYLAKGSKYETEAEFQWGSYRTWSDEAHRLGEEI